MRNKINFLIIIVSAGILFNSCASIKDNKQRNIFVKQFIGSEGITNSLQSFYDDKTITIYDENKVLVKENGTFHTLSQTINILTSRPTSNNYLMIKNFTLNQNLACLTFLTSDKEKGIVFYLKRKDNKEGWQIANMFKQNTR
ncbi:hypothetical protein [Chryseobacterium paludis]|uniref:hypothetical protein n=1 Tax=Chryseobacterium paludis TaxID=2956784 RepID=UPI0021BE6B7F|nr:hypothetical protein [Chryseobacterium paludis]